MQVKDHTLRFKDCQEYRTLYVKFYLPYAYVMRHRSAVNVMKIPVCVKSFTFVWQDLNR